MSDEQLLLSFQEAVRGRYAIESELGRGAMGVVFLARDLRLDRPVAVKVLLPSLATDDDRARFLREARLAARLSHPHVVPIHAVEEARDFVFFAMTYVDGGTLAERLTDAGPMPAEEAGRLLREIAWALAYAHAQGIIHRDIKPDNVLLELGTRRALVTDFGIAKPEEDDLGGTRLGTPGFASPEQATGEIADARSDLYALGALGFCLLTGQPPFTGETRAIVTRQLEKPAPRVRDVAPGTPRDLAAVIDRCLAIDPERRYQSADEVAAAIGRAMPTQRELPPALRTWVVGRPGVDRVMALAASVPVAMMVVGVVLALAALSQGAAASIGAAAIETLLFIGKWFGVVAVLGALYAASRVLELRKLMQAGISLPRIRAALRLREEQYAEENSVAPLPPWWARLVWRLTQLHGVALLALIVVSASFTSPLTRLFGFEVVNRVLIPVMQYLGSALVVLVPVSIFFPGRRMDVRPFLFAQRLRFWLSSAGDRFSHLAGWRLTRPEVPGATANLPTELALEDATIAIYEALPPAQRRALAELKPTVERLARVAERERRALRAGPGSAQRLAATIDALDTLRLGLLRLRAGSATLAGVTTDLHAARDLSQQAGRLADAASDVNALLKPQTE